MSILVTRRALVGTLATGLLAGCDQVQNSRIGRSVLLYGETIDRQLHTSLGARTALAREYSAADMSPVFRSNGTANPNTPAYNALVADGFARYRLQVGGLVDRPLALSLGQIRRMPARTQITRHDCVEGWTAIGKWHGPTLGSVLHAAGIRRDARYVVFSCADSIAGEPYYESIDLIDAFHPQTILAWGMNDRPLAVAHGAPIRLRVERQLGYKHAKYVMRIDAVSSLAAIAGGRGGYWEDRGYEWYAGI
jgi:DMSO/TMAO reductase YedYZ molybdopterin-dependent catalytic subunit